MEASSCHDHQTVKKFSGLGVKRQPGEKLTLFTWLKGLTLSTIARYELFVGSVAVSMPTYG
jgi:hypothetical protein